MILFDQDWHHYPYARTHITTDNRTWVRLAIMYRDHFKLKNWRFHLALLDPDLEFVNPYDKNLNEIQKLKILKECANNPFYFFREVMRIGAKSGSGSNPFRADRGTIATLWAYFNHIDSTNIQMRQTGKTIKIEAVAIWLLVIGSENTNILYGTVDNSKQQDCVRSIKEKLVLLPDYLYKPMKGKDLDNRGAVSNARRNNYIQFAIGQKDKRVANNAGRGYSVANKIWDEVAETINSHISISAATGSSNAVIEEARSKGEPYGTIYACTAGTLDRPEGAFYYNLAQSGVSWNERLLDSQDSQDLRITVGQASKDPLAPLIDITMSWRQLGISEDRFKEIVALSKREANGDMDKVKRECYSIWSRGGVGNPLTKEQLATIFESEVEPKRVEKTNEKVLIRWFISEQEIDNLKALRRIGIGIDTSQGVVRDACSVTLVDLATLEVIGRSDISSVNLQTYASFVCTLLVSLESPIIVIENKASGQAIIDAVIIKLHNMGIDPFSVLFNRIWQDPDKYQRQYETVFNTPIRRRTVDWYNQFKALFGFSTTAALRQTLYDQVLTEAVRLAGSKVRDATLSNQLRNLIEKNGRIDHTSDGHDDAVMSWLFISWFCMYGRNFKRYGLTNGIVLSQTMRSESGKFSAEDYERQQEISHLQDLIPPLEEEYALNYDSYYGAAIKHRIQLIYQELEVMGVEAPLSLEDYFIQLRKER